MKRTTAAAFAFLFVAAAAFAGDTPQRYLVATKRPFRAGALAAVVRDARQGVPLRDVDGFNSFDGFAATLTSSEVAALRASSEVRWVEPVIERHAFAQAFRSIDSQTVPYGVDLIHARQAWVATQSATINVVVMDTGVDYHHPELKDIWAGGYNFVADSTDPMDDMGHGTHVAGTIAAANDLAGVVGVAPQVRLWSTKVLNSDGDGNSAMIIKAIDWIVAKKKELGGNWVANLSLGSKGSSSAEREAFARGVAAGILFVAATGNDSVDGVPAPVSYPAAYDGVMGVGAIDSTRAIAVFSNQGAQVDVVAPGVDVLSTVPLGMGRIAWAESANARYMGAGLTGAKLGRVTAEYVYCGLGKPGEIPASVAGKIALIKRGELRFTEKTHNAKTAGAIGVAIFNLDESALNWTLWPDGDADARLADWPVTVGLTKADGEALVAKNGGTLTIVNQKDDYDFYSGTSMAAPHTAAAAAFLWSVAPKATASEVSAALIASAVDLGTVGRDTVFGTGIVDVYAAVRQLAPSSLPTGPTTGRRILKRH